MPLVLYHKSVSNKYVNDTWKFALICAIWGTFKNKAHKVNLMSNLGSPQNIDIKFDILRVLQG